MIDLGAIYRDFFQRPALEDEMRDLFGNLVTTTGSFTSAVEFDKNGDPINQMLTNQAPRQQLEGGLLSQDMGPAAQAMARVKLMEAYNPQQVESILSPYTQLSQSQGDLKNRMLLQQQKQQMEMQQGITPIETLEAVNKLRTPYTKEMAPHRKALTNYNDAVDLVQKSDFKNGMLTGAESVALVKKYLKQVLPDESVMGDDIATLLSSQGVPEYMRSFLSRITASGTVSNTGAAEIMAAMGTMAESASKNRDRIRAQFEDEAGQYKLPTTFMGERIKRKQGMPKGTIPLGGGKYRLPDGRVIRAKNG